MLNAENTYFAAQLPIYTIHCYRDDLFKVIKFKGNRSGIKCRLGGPEEFEHYEEKLDPAFSRARSMVLQYALCNEWKWFFTGTIDKTKFDRFNLDTYYKSLSQWIRDERKRTESQISFLLIPEYHKNGAWHIHGLINNLPDSETELFTKHTRIPGRKRVPRKLIDGGYSNWPRYMEKFGYCSLGLIRNRIATAFYISKYVSKDMCQRKEDLGQHLYYHSRPLKKANKAADIYIGNILLDNLSSKCDYTFCQSGMVEAPWSFPFSFDGADINAAELERVRSFEIPEDFNPSEIDPFYEQMEIRLL